MRTFPQSHRRNWTLFLKAVQKNLKRVFESVINKSWENGGNGEIEWTKFSKIHAIQKKDIKERILGIEYFAQLCYLSLWVNAISRAINLFGQNLSNHSPNPIYTSAYLVLKLQKPGGRWRKDDWGCDGGRGTAAQWRARMVERRWLGWAGVLARWLPFLLNPLGQRKGGGQTKPKFRNGCKNQIK